MSLRCNKNDNIPVFNKVCCKYRLLNLIARSSIIAFLTFGISFLLCKFTFKTFASYASCLEPISSPKLFRIILKKVLAFSYYREISFYLLVVSIICRNNVKHGIARIKLLNSVFCILNSPSSLSSSSPAVSINTTGPKGSNSIGLKTGSVVPATGDVNALYPDLEIALISADFPAFVEPKTPDVKSKRFWCLVDF